MNTSKTLTFCGLPCKVEISEYTANNQVAIELVIADDANKDDGYFPGEPVATATVCIPERTFENGQTLIKDYSENEGILKVLVRSGVVEDMNQSEWVGREQASLVRVL